MRRPLARPLPWTLASLALPGAGVAGPVVNCMDTGPFEIPLAEDGVGVETSSVPDYELDIDCDGEPDYRFDVNEVQGFHLVSGATPEHRLQGTANENKLYYLERLGAGETVAVNDESRSSGVFGGQSYDPRDPQGWRGADGFVGVRFPRGDAFHFGWIRAEIAQDFSGVLVNYAYEEQPEVPIVTALVDNMSFSGSDLNLSLRWSEETPDRVLSGFLLAGDEVGFRIDVRNWVGPDDASGIRVRSQPPPEIQGLEWRCEGFNGASCPVATGVGPIDETVDLAVRERLRYLLSGTVDVDARGALRSSASVEFAGTDPNLFNNSAELETEVRSGPDIRVRIDDGRDQVLQFEELVYEVVFENLTSFEAPEVNVSTTDPEGLLNQSWTCQAVGGQCGAASGTGPIAQVVSIDGDGSVTYTLRGVAARNAGEEIVISAAAVVVGSAVDGNVDDNTDQDRTTVVSELIPETVFEDGFEGDGA